MKRFNPSLWITILGIVVLAAAFLSGCGEESPTNPVADFGLTQQSELNNPGQDFSLPGTNLGKGAVMANIKVIMSKDDTDVSQRYPVEQGTNIK